MTSIKAFLAKFRRDEDGATLVEYGIALSIAVTVGATALATLGGTVESQFTSANTAMGGTAPSSGG